MTWSNFSSLDFFNRVFASHDPNEARSGVHAPLFHYYLVVVRGEWRGWIESVTRRTYATTLRSDDGSTYAEKIRVFCTGFRVEHNFNMTIQSGDGPSFFSEEPRNPRATRGVVTSSQGNIKLMIFTYMESLE
jgi:hypothetical protein